MTCNRLLISLLISLLYTASAQSETLRVRVTDAATGEALEDAVIEVILAQSANGSPVQPRETTEAIVDQQDKEFVPPVTVVPRGSRVSFPNSDNILHHVYSFSAARTFDIPLYGRGDNSDFAETFDIAGVVEIGCNIHDWMLAYIYVADSALAAKTDAAGSASIDNLPPGSYQLKLWHARLQESESLIETVEVAAGTVSEATFALDLGRDRSIRRAPSSTRNRYR